MLQYTNYTSIPLSVAVFLATDNYDHDEETISVTTLLKPVRQVVLSARVPPSDATIDISGMVNSRMGSAIHDAIENAWKSNYQNALKALGYPQRVIDKVVINPNPDELTGDEIPVYMEQRAHKMLLGKKVSGKYDFVADGRLEDFKSTSVYTYINGSNDEKHMLQGSLYRWLNPQIITRDEMAIQYIFTDWAADRARSDPKYPSNRVVEKLHKLLPIEQAEAYARNKIQLIDTYWNAEETEIPLCTDQELWRKDPVWKYYKNPASTKRSTKNFDNRHDAYVRLAEDGNVGTVVEVPGQVVACKYCPAFPVCTQKDSYIATGELQL